MAPKYHSRRMCVSCAEAVSSLTQSMVQIDLLPFAACRSPPSDPISCHLSKMYDLIMP